MTALALAMTGADVLKLRRKRGTMIWVIVLALAPVVILFAVRAILHSSTPAQDGPAGGLEGYRDGLRLLCLFLGPLAAILVGVEAGTSDASAGVFRDLVVTGRSRLALFLVRVPAALAVCWTVMLVGYALVVLGTYLFGASLPTPDAALLANGLAFTLLATGVVCVVAVGFSSLIGSRPAAITALIGWQLVASPLIAQIEPLGSARKALLSQAVSHFSPVDAGGGGHGSAVSMTQGTAVVVLIAWVAAMLALGAWRTRTMDA